MLSLPLWHLRLCLWENVGHSGCDVKTFLYGENGFGQMRQRGGDRQRQWHGDGDRQQRRRQQVGKQQSGKEAMIGVLFGARLRLGGCWTSWWMEGADRGDMFLGM